MGGAIATSTTHWNATNGMWDKITEGSNLSPTSEISRTFAAGLNGWVASSQVKVGTKLVSSETPTFASNPITGHWALDWLTTTSHDTALGPTVSVDYDVVNSPTEQKVINQLNTKFEWVSRLDANGRWDQSRAADPFGVSVGTVNAFGDGGYASSTTSTWSPNPAVASPSFASTGTLNVTGTGYAAASQHKVNGMVVASDSRSAQTTNGTNLNRNGAESALGVSTTWQRNRQDPLHSSNAGAVTAPPPFTRSYSENCTRNAAHQLDCPGNGTDLTLDPRAGGVASTPE